MDKVIVKQRQKVKVQLGQSVSVSDDYLRLSNKPSINGVALTGDKTYKDLNILSSKPSEYQDINLGAADAGSFLIILSETDNKKVKLCELTEGRLKTADAMPDDTQVGNYVFLLKGEKTNGADSK
jgi:hypothetical protein